MSTAIVKAESRRNKACLWLSPRKTPSPPQNNRVNQNPERKLVPCQPVENAGGKADSHCDHGHAFLIALLQITLCKKGSNFVAGALRVPLQFAWPVATFEQRRRFARRGFGGRSSPQATDHNARGGDHREQQILGNGYPVPGRIGPSRKTVGPGWRARKPRSRPSAARPRPSSRNRSRRRQEAQSGSKRLTSAGLSAGMNAHGQQGTGNTLPRGAGA